MRKLPDLPKGEHGFTLCCVTSQHKCCDNTQCVNKPRGIQPVYMRETRDDIATDDKRGKQQPSLRISCEMLCPDCYKAYMAAQDAPESPPDDEGTEAQPAVKMRSKRGRKRRERAEQDAELDQ